MNSGTRVRFEKPPVVEVACSVLFTTKKPIRGTQIALYGQGIKNDFPQIEEAPPLVPVIEVQEPGAGAVELGYGFGPLPPLRRTWFISADGRSLIQLQEDRFIFNWKKATEDDKYPSYDEVIEKFNIYLTGFLDFLNSEDLGPPSYRQFELIYVNQIPLGKAETLEIAEGRVLVDHLRDNSRDRFLPDPVAVNWATIYALPNSEGRLYVAAQSARAPDGRRILRLDITARGMPAEANDTSRRAWFDRAHTWITHGFADLTIKELQDRVWKRTE
jgi:uncharacterized protein (TIGR04255 family)